MRDKQGFFGQIQPDGSIEGGDSLCWNGHWEYLNRDSQRPRRIIDMSQYYVGRGGFVRHPNPDATFNGFGAYYKNPWDGVISRDQFTGLLCGLIAQNKRKLLLVVGLHWALRLFLFSYNTRKNGAPPGETPWKIPDITGPDIWATYLRGFGVWSWLFWPLLCIFDLHLLINVLIHNFKKESDVINFLGKLFVALEFCPTPVSLMAWEMLDKKQILLECRSYWIGWRNQDAFYFFTKRRFAMHGYRQDI